MDNQMYHITVAEANRYKSAGSSNQEFMAQGYHDKVKWDAYIKVLTCPTGT